MINKFLYNCALGGISDFLYRKHNKSPKWMNKTEDKAWKIGYNYARKTCNK